MDHPKALGVDRDEYFRSYDLRANKARRLGPGSTWYLRHRLTRWWGFKTSLAIGQLFYILAVVIMFSFAVVKLRGATNAEPAASMVSTAIGPIASPKVPSEAALGYAVPIAAVIIAIYKNWVASYQRCAPDEMARREAVASLLQSLYQAVPKPVTVHEAEARLKEICECIRRDMQEFCQVSDHDTDVVLLKLSPDFNHSLHDGFLEPLARDKPRAKGWTVGGRRHASGSFAYEAIRQKRAFCYHDVHHPAVRRLFGGDKWRYRTVFCMPLTLPGESIPYGAITINTKLPYLLWPFGTDKMDRRLGPYVELVNLFASKYLTGSRYETAHDPKA